VTHGRRADPRRTLTRALALPAVALLGGALLLASAALQPHDRPAARPGSGLYLPARRGPAWTPTGPMHDVRARFTAVRLRDGRVLALGGDSALGNHLLYAELYDPRTGRWTRTGALHDARWSPAAAVLPDGRVLAAGGGSLGATERTAEVYDPRTGRWTLTRPMAAAIPTDDATATVLRGGMVLVVGNGFAQTFDPRTGRWMDLHVSPALFNIPPGKAILLRDGRVLVVNGRDAEGFFPDAVVYDPRTNRWTPTGRMPPDSGYDGEAAALLRDGRVLVVGGFAQQEPYPMAGAEVYDPRTNRWTPTASPGVRRAYALAATLRDGQVLLVGGSPSSTSQPHLAECDLYNARTGRWTPTAALRVPRAQGAGVLLGEGRYLAVGGILVDDFTSLNGTTVTVDPRVYQGEVFTP